MFFVIELIKRGFKYLSLKSDRSIEGCLYTHPSIIFFLFGITISAKEDSREWDLNIIFSKHILEILSYLEDIYKLVPPFSPSHGVEYNL